MARSGYRIGVVGATGSLGGEVLAALDASSLPVGLVRVIATDASLGTDIEFQGEIYPVETELSLAGLDAVISCAPPEASLACVREALRAEVSCIDGSGALLASQEVPLVAAGLPGQAPAAGAPLVSSPPGPALAWAPVLAPLHERAGIRVVTATALEAASAAGRGAIDVLYAESVSLFNHEDPPEPEVIGQPLAFDSLPVVGALEDDGHSLYEQTLALGLGRLLTPDLSVRVTAAHIPAFVGHAASLVIDTEAPLDAKEAQEILSEAPGVEVWDHESRGPNLRAAAGRDVTLVGRVRSTSGDETPAGGLSLWLAADLLRLAGHNAVRLLEGLLADPASGAAGDADS